MMGFGGRIPELEGIRGILSVLVVAGHVHAAPIFWYPGCMEFFFVISGFLITRILLAPPRLSLGFLKTYAARRALRIWPMYYVALGAYLAANLALASLPDFRWHGPDLSWEPTWQPIVLSALFLQYTDAFVSFPGFDYSPLFGHSWSVAVEEQFYFLWPLALLAVARTSRAFQRTLLIGLIVSGVVSRCVMYITFDATLHLALLPSRFDSFGFGIALAYLLRDGLAPEVARIFSRRFRLLALAGLAILLPHLAQGYGFDLLDQRPALMRTLFDPTLGFAVLAFAVVGSVVVNTGAPRQRWLTARPLMRLGTISYSTYLMHILVVVAVVMLFQRYNLDGIWLQLAVTLVLAIGLSHVTYNHVEARAMAYKARFDYRRAAGLMPPSGDGIARVAPAGQP